jgi:hypothetical protein
MSAPTATLDHATIIYSPIACGHAGGSNANYTSTFVMDSASSASCLESNHSQCAPKIKITIDTTCSITLANVEFLDRISEYQSCAWNEVLPIIGAKVTAKVDLAQVGRWRMVQAGVQAG